MKQSYRIYNDFSKGLNTDFNGVNQDPNATIEIDNFIINNNGTISKRKGLEVESSLDTGIVIPDLLKNKNVNIFNWKNVRGKDGDILVVQIGEKLYFYTVSDNIASGKLSSEINLADYLTSERLLFEDIRISFTQIKGVLVCAHSQLSPFYLSVDKGEVKDTIINLKVRDYYGIPSAYKTLERPTILTKEHLYNLYNQGWDNWAVYACFFNNGFYPSDGDSPNYYYKSTLEFRRSGIAEFQKAYANKSIKRFTKEQDDFDLIEKVSLDAKIIYDKGADEHRLMPYYNDLGNYYLRLSEAYGASMIDFRDMEDLRTDNQSAKGRVITDLFQPQDVTSIVSRPIVKAPDTAINRNKWNDFHLVDNVLDVFYDDVRKEIKLVVELDKEHGLYGGFNETANCVVNASLGHYNELNQKKIGDEDTYRIFNYELPDVVQKITQKKDYKLIKKDEGIWFDEGGHGSTTYFWKFKDSYSKDNAFLEQFDYMITGETDYYIQNLTNDPHDYKVLWYINKYSNSSGINNTRKSMNEEHLRNYNFQSKLKEYNTYSYPMFGTTMSTDTVLDSFSKYAGNTFARTYSKRIRNSEGVVRVPSYSSHSWGTFNTTQFDFQQIKRKNVSAQKISDIKIKNAACRIEALSTKKCVLVIPTSSFNKPNSWLMNASELGELLCFQDIFDTMKIKLSQTLYDKMKKVYENMARDDYASKMLDEEYKDNVDYFSIKKINAVQTLEGAEHFSSIPADNNSNAYKQKQHVSVVLELDKPHNKDLYANGARIGYRESVNCIQGDYTSYSSIDLFKNKRVLIPQNFRYIHANSVITNSVNWGNYSSDYGRHLSQGQVIKLKDRSEFPTYFQSFNISDFISANVAPTIDSYQKVIDWTEKNKTNFEINTMFLLGKQSVRAYTNYKNNIETTDPQLQLAFYTRDDNALNTTMLSNGWKRGRDRYGSTGTKNLSTTGQPEVIRSYIMYSYSKGSDKNDGDLYGSATKDNNVQPTTYDFIECHMSPMNLNMDKKSRKCLKENFNVQYIGDKYISFTINTDSSLVYNDLNETVTEADALRELPFIIERNGNFINLHELLNMKFSLNKTISRSEILTKQRAYRNAWTWDMDGVDDSNDSPVNDEPALDPNNLVFEDVAEEFRPNCVKAFASRIFYGGINSSKYSNTIFYSNIVTEDIKSGLENCYTENDPTSRFLNATIATDGGYISINDAGEIMGMEVVGSILCVVCSNGVYGISGANRAFTATSQSVKKISNVGCISPKSIKVIDNSLVYVGEYALNILELNNISADMTPADMTKDRINVLFNSIPLSSKKYIKTIYDDIKSIVYFLYNSEETNGNDPDFNSVLIYNVVKDSFFKFSFNKNNYKIKDAFINEKNYKDDIRLKLSCMDDTSIKFFEFKNNNFLDYVDADYTASLKTAGQIIKSPTNILVGGTVITHLLNEPNSSCICSVDYDFNNTNKSTKPIEVYKDKVNNKVVFNKVMLRGSGNNLNLNYHSPKGKACEILGFEFNFNIVEK